MSKPNPKPSKTDLLTILRHHERRPDPKVEALTQKHADAEAALKAYLKGNKTYQRLRKRELALNTARWKLQHKRNDEVKAARTDCFNAVRLYGVTPAVVKKIASFLRKYP